MADLVSICDVAQDHILSIWCGQCLAVISRPVDTDVIFVHMQVPYSPRLPFLFFGEEMSMLVRMWTRGWDIFSPTQVCFRFCLMTEMALLEVLIRLASTSILSVFMSKLQIILRMHCRCDAWTTWPYGSINRGKYE